MKLIKYFLLTALALNVACGRQGPPRPPEDFAPGSVSNVRVAADVDGVTLFWQIPETTATGKELTDLASFIVRRAVDKKEGRLSYEELATIAVDPAVKQAQYEYRDNSVTAGERYIYNIDALNKDEVAGPASESLRVFFRGSSSIIER